MSVSTHIPVKKAIAPQIATDNTPLVSSIIDMKGYEAVRFIIATGTIADADTTITPLLEDGDNSSLNDNAAVADAYMPEGTEADAAFQYDDDGEIRIITYRGTKRYCRLTLTPANNTGNLPVSVVAELIGGQYLPITQPAS